MAEASWRAYEAECLGTFWLVTSVAGAVLADALTGGGLGPLGVAVGLGFGAASAIYALGHFSGGHFNPAVTIGAWLAGKFEGRKVIPYIVSQLIGAAIAAGVLAAIFPAAIVAATSAGGTFLASDVSYSGGVLAEALATFALVLVALGVMDERNKMAGIEKNLAPLAVGMVLLVDVLLFGGLTGASMNPARSFGPALVSGNWELQSLYWIGPIVGGAIGALVYKWAFWTRGELFSTRRKR